MRTAALTAALAGAALLLCAGCGGVTDAAGPQTYLGPSARLGDGNVRTYVTLDPQGRPAAVGIRISAAAMDGLPTQDSMAPTMVMLDFPDQAASTPFEDVMLDWNPHGHQPAALFGKPHFDMHFDLVDMATLDAITPTDPGFAAKAAHLPDPAHTPADYAPLPGAPLAGQAVPGMGLHLVDGAAPPIPGSYDFQQILLHGSWDGIHTFIEPMMTRAWLLTRPAHHEDLKQPQLYQKPGFYPTTYDVGYDAGTAEYDIALGGMVERRAG